MASIERTAYPRFRHNLTADEIVEWYQSSDEETAFVRQYARKEEQQLALLLSLKSVQRLGYFPDVTDVALEIQRFMCDVLQLPHSLLPVEEAERTRHRHRQALRSHLNLQPYTGHGEPIVDAAVTKAAETMSDPADLINVALEQLYNNQVELLAFSTINRRVNHIRHQVHQRMFRRVLIRLTSEQRGELDELLVVPEEQRFSGFTLLKETPGKATLKEIRRWEQRLAWVKSLLDAQPILSGITYTKIKQFAAQANALELSDMRRIRNEGKRYALLICLLQHARSRLSTRSRRCMRRMRLIHRNAKERLRLLREQYLELNEQMVSAFSEIVQHASMINNDQALGRHVRQTLTAYGGVQQLATQASMVSTYHNNNYMPLLWGCYRTHRSLLFRLAEQVEIRTATQDTSVVQALEFILQHRNSRRKCLPAEIAIEFASQRWRRLVEAKEDNLPVFKRKQLEVCIFHYVAVGLSRGDLYVVGSEEYADYRQQLLPWSECEPRVEPFCNALELPATPGEFVQQLRSRLTAAAERVDAGFPNNVDLSFDTDGKLHLRRAPKRDVPEGLEEFRGEVKNKLPERHLLDILKFVHYWVNYTRHFGPPSGSDAKLADAVSKYLVTIFGYGCNLGAAQTARHTRSIVTRRSMKRINDQHGTTEKLEVATRDVIDEYARFRLPFFWGSGKNAVADGTHFKLLDNNLLGEHHFRYGKYGAIAFHHVSDTYIALFSHFIACGVWEAIYILDGLLKNESAIQPDTVYADTHGQTESVFGLAHLLGIQLMPRMRNWNKVAFCRPDSTAMYKHIDALFTDTVNWKLIETHWQDLMQVVLSIQAGKVLPSMLLQKLGTHNRRNKLFRAFTEVGRAVRTVFLLDYISSMELRQEIRAATTIVEAYNSFIAWLSIGGDGVIRQRDPVEQEKQIKYMNLVANSVIMQNVVDMTNVLHEMALEGHDVKREHVARLSPYMTEHIRRFGEYFLDMSEKPEPLQPDRPFLTN